MARKLVVAGKIKPAPYTPTITLDGKVTRIPRQTQRLSTSRVMKGGANTVYVKMHRAEQTGRTTSEAPNRARQFRVDMAWLETMCRKWADGRIRKRCMENCRCTGKCECEL